MGSCATIPIALLKDQRLSLNDIRVFGALSLVADCNGKCVASKEELRSVSEVRNVGKGISMLVRCGYLKVEMASEGMSYQLLQNPDTPRKTGQTLSEFAAEYVQYISAVRSASYTRDVKTAFRKLQSHTGDLQLNELSRMMLETFFASSFKRAPYETARNFRTLRAAFSHSVDWGYLTDNPFKKIKTAKLPKPIPSFVNEGELAKITQQTTNPTLEDIFLFGFHTGTRLSEILNLQWDSINFLERTITVSNTDSFTTKNKKERVIPINETLYGMLERRKPKVLSIDRRDLVFGKTSVVPYSVNYVGRKFKEAVRKAGLSEKLHTHCLRHSFASILLGRGAPIVTVKELMGHSNISTTMIYSHVRHEDMTNAVKLLDGAAKKTNEPTWNL